MRAPGLLAIACFGCGGSDPSRTDPPGVDGPLTPDDAATTPVVDDDGDGIDDELELELASDYLPFIALSPDDGCTRAGLLVRVRPHPADATKILIVYDHLFETDCGLDGHTGDNEVFGVAVDPALPPPTGILAIKTASHQNTPCERITQCTTCSNDSRTQCDRAVISGVPGGAMYPVVYASKDKHGQYATKGSCGFGTCFDRCEANDVAHRPPIANAGEPGHPLITDLTAQGFITPANGWTEVELMNLDPWGAGDFGGAGNIADDLIDPTFEAAPCAP